MTRPFSDQQLSRLSEFVTARFGLHFPPKRWRDLAPKIAAAADQLGYEAPGPFVDWLLSAPLTRSQLDTLAGCLTIGETYFFREPKSFDALESHVLPELIQARRGKEQRLRIWSAGCSTGEEAYSIAILLRKMIPDQPAWNVTILATDLNASSLQKAALGVYGDWSFRGTPRWVKEWHLTRTADGRFEVAAAVRKMVTFSQLNLMQDAFPSLATNTNAMDIIFCRNVLMYFATEGMAKVIEQFHHALLPGGWLIVSPCETSPALFRRFEPVSFQGATLYRKDGSGKRAEPAPAFSTVAAPPAPMPPHLPGQGTLVPPVGTPAVRPPSPPESVPRVTEQPDAPLDDALALFRKGLYADAAALLSELALQGARKHGSDVYRNAVTLLVRSYANQGEFAKALEWADKAIATNKLDPELRYLQAVILQEQGAAEAAAAALKKTLYLDQHFVLAHFALANLTLQQGKAKDAARHLENAAALLRECGDDDLLPGSEGLSARRLGEIVAATMAGLAGR